MSKSTSDETDAQIKKQSFSILDVTGFLGIFAISAGVQMEWGYGLALIVFGTLILLTTIWASR